MPCDVVRPPPVPPAPRRSHLEGLRPHRAVTAAPARGGTAPPPRRDHAVAKQRRQRQRIQPAVALTRLP